MTEDAIQDPFEATRATYGSEAGARAYLARETPMAGARDASCRSLLDGIPLAGARALDMGCGSGGDVAWLLANGADAYGVDRSAPLLAAAEARHGHAGRWIQADFRHRPAMPWPGEAPIDLLWSMVSLVHVPRDETPALLARWASWLRPGGRMAIVTKQGEGEAVTRGLGPDLPRVMVLRSVEEVAGPLLGAGLAIDRVVSGKPSVEPASADRLMMLLLRRPELGRG
jgi:SAM-dependent methyltransferase